MAAERQEPRKVLSAALSVVVHLALLGVLIYGVSWQNQEAGPVQADLWSDLPGPQAPMRAAPPPPPPPEPEPPKPEPKPAPEPRPAPEPKAEPTPKADIALKAKKLEEEKRKQEELKREDEKKKQQEEKKKQDEAKRKAQDKLLKEEQARQAAAAEGERKAMAARQAANNALINDFKSRIQSKIKRFVVLPPDLTGNPQAEFDVTLMPTGEVLNVRLTRSSGVPAYDNAVERAIYKAQPLPLPPDVSLFGQFRELHLTFRPRE